MDSDNAAPVRRRVRRRTARRATRIVTPPASLLKGWLRRVTDPVFSSRGFVRLLVVVACSLSFVSWRMEQASAAEVASANSSDELRCSSGGYNRGTATTWGQLSFCYTKDPFPVAWRGTHFQSSSSTTQLLGSIAAQWYSTSTLNGCSMYNTTFREAWYGPFTASPYGNIPANAFVIRTDCADGTYWNNVTSVQSGVLTTVRNWLYPASGIAWSITGSADTTDTARVGSQGGIKWYGIVNTGGSSFVTLRDSMDWPPSWYPGGAEFTELQAFCGAAVTITGRDPADVVEAGEVLTWSTEWTSGYTGNIQVRYPTRPDQWYTVFSEGTIANPSVSAQTVPGALTGNVFGFKLSTIQMRCWSQQTDEYVYLDYGQADEDIGDGRSRPCDLAKWYWPQPTTYGIGDIATFDLSYSGLVTTTVADSDIDIDVAFVDPETLFPPAQSAWTWESVATDVPLGSNESYDIPAEYQGDDTQFRFRCTDELGQVINVNRWQVRKVFKGGTYTAQETEASCFVVSISWNPVSLVTGAVRSMMCALRVLFVPSEEGLSVIREAADEASERAPISYLAEGGGRAVTLVTGMSGAVTSETNSCWTFFEGDDVIADGGLDLCPSEAGAGSGLWATGRSLLSVLYWASFALLLFLATLKVVA